MTIVERLRATGIRRSGTPRRGFRYRGPDGSKISAHQRARIEALKIPPAWRDVAIHPSTRGMVQAVGRDAAGRWQYLYHRAQAARRERQKRERLVRFIEALPRARRAMARDLRLHGIPREKVLAGILRILSTCFLRPGSQAYADDNGSYGIATLRPRHVAVRGDRVRFDFVGKSGRRQQAELTDRRVARLVRELLAHPGEVFKFRSEDGALVDVRRRHINAYIKEVMGQAFSAKDFRTWAGTLLAACALARRAEPAASGADRLEIDPRGARRERQRQVAAAIREVADRLGNTPAVCRSGYVFPDVIRSFERGRVIPRQLADLGDPAHDRGAALARCERGVLRLLRGERPT